MAEKSRNFQGCHNFLKKLFVYWRSKKLEDSAKKIFKSFDCLATWSNTQSNWMFECCYNVRNAIYGLLFYYVYIVGIMPAKNTPETDQMHQIFG